jgi:hypothetical protein
MAGCDTDEIVQVEDPAQLQPTEVNNAAAVPAIVNGSFRQFIGGYSGFGDDAFISNGAVISDEFYWGDSFTTRNAADRRTLQPPVLTNISDAAFGRLQQARMLARRAYAAVGKFESELDDPDLYRSDLRTTEGYIYVTLSEGWCGAVPFSNVPDEGDIDPAAIEHGAPKSTVQMNEAALPLFDASIALTGNRLARVGKARALLNLGRYAEAAAVVATVPTNYVFLIEHSTNSSSQNNGVAVLIDNGRFSISNNEGGTNSATGAGTRPDTTSATTLANTINAEGLNFRSAKDPRIPYSSAFACFTSSIFCRTNLNYPDFDSDVPLASGVEARLIEAEAALQAGDVTTMMARLNTLRASAAAILPLLYPSQKQVFPIPAAGAVSLPALADPAVAGTTAAQMFAARRDLLFRERAFWLFNTGHRQGDLRRLIRNYGLPQSQVFPTGPYFRGGSFGTDVAYPVPFNEENNPLFVRDACNTASA